MKKLASLIIFVGYLSGCGSSLSIDSSDAKQPQVLSISPPDGSTVNDLNEIEVTLSRAVSPSTVHSASFLIFQADDIDLSLVSTDEISSAIEDSEIESLSGVYSISEDSTGITWVPGESLQENVVYQVILTSAIQTADHFPLNQTPGGDTTYFISRFTLSSNEGGASNSADQEAPLDSGDESEEDVGEISSLVINEVYYDDTTSDTDGNLFVELFGTPGGNLSGYSLRFINGADGEKTDEVVFGEEAIIPDDCFFVLADSKTGSSGETNVVEADVISNFDPQNGPDSVQLFNPSGELIDVVGYGEGLPLFSAEGFSLYEESPALTGEAGLSLARRDGLDTGNNSTDFALNLHPSPGTGEVTNDNPDAMDEGESVSSGETSTESTETTELTEEVEDESDPSSQNQDEANETETGEEDVHITEVVTDPQNDWGDSTGGNGIPFDSLFGSGTIGSTDEWIEIKNGRDDSVDLTGWRLEMIDGTDEVEIFSAPSSSLVFFFGGSVSSFQPGEFLVVGNPPGDLKNTLDLALYDEDDSLVDSLSVYDANATGSDDESYQLVEDEWVMGESTIGF